DVDRVDLAGGMDELKRRLEILLGAKPEAPVDESERTARVEQTQDADRRQRIAEAGGQLLTAAVRVARRAAPTRGRDADRDAGARSTRFMAAGERHRLACSARPCGGSSRPR